MYDDHIGLIYNLHLFPTIFYFRALFACTVIRHMRIYVYGKGNPPSATAQEPAMHTNASLCHAYLTDFSFEDIGEESKYGVYCFGLSTDLEIVVHYASGAWSVRNIAQGMLVSGTDPAALVAQVLLLPIF